MPGMTIEVAADQIEVVRPGVECVRGGMNAEEATAPAHKVEQRRLLRVAHGNFAGCVEHHRGVPLEVSGRKFRRVVRCDDLKGAGIPSKLHQYRTGKRYHVVPIAGRMCEIENAFWRALCTHVDWSDYRRAADECDELSSRHNALPTADQSEELSTYRRAPALRLAYASVTSAVQFMTSAWQCRLWGHRPIEDIRGAGGRAHAPHVVAA